MDRETIDRFYKHIKFPANPNGCWEFDSVSSTGYGHFSIKGKQFGAHRISWLIFFGYWPKKMVLHKCDNKPCVRPDHLFEGTAWTNSKDAKLKGRTPSGERNGLAKLTTKLASKIFSEKGKYTQRSLASYYGVSQSTIWSIQSGKTWVST